jgi:hypothetical protein
MCKTIILPVVLYGCETRSLTLREEHRLKVFENRVLRRILRNIKLQRHIVCRTMFLLFRWHNIGMNIIPQFTCTSCFGLSGHHRVHSVYTIPVLVLLSAVPPYTGQCLHTTGGDVFLRNVGRTTRRHIPEDDTLHNHRCENLKSHCYPRSIPVGLPICDIMLCLYITLCN